MLKKKCSIIKEKMPIFENELIKDDKFFPNKDLEEKDNDEFNKFPLDCNIDNIYNDLEYKEEERKEKLTTSRDIDFYIKFEKIKEIGSNLFMLDGLLPVQMNSIQFSFGKE